MTISKKTLKKLWGLSGGRCAFPQCKTRLVADASDLEAGVLIGEVCHIVADSKVGPRGQSELTTQQRDHYDNLIVLCGNHHTVVDQQPLTYPVEKLKQLKAQHESWVCVSLEERVKERESEEPWLDRYLDTFARIPSIKNPFVSNQVIPLHEIYVDRTELYCQAVEVLKRDFKDKFAKPFDNHSFDLLIHFALYLFTPVSGPKQLFLQKDYEDFCTKVGNGQLSNALDDYWLRSKLINQWDGQQTYHFIHLTFQEWSVARQLSEWPVAEVTPVVDAFIYNPYWKEVFRFYAGFCALETDRAAGLQRFMALIKPITDKPDLFRLQLFWLAPLLTEFQRGSGEAILGYDLRIALVELVKSIDVGDDPFIKIMVELDPPFFLEQSYIAINAHLAKMKLPQLSLSSLAHTRLYHDNHPPIISDIEMASKLLRHIFHPDAVEIICYLVELDVAGDSAEEGDNEREEQLMDEIYIPLSRAIAVHSTEALRTRVREAFGKKKDEVEQLNILFFLSKLTCEENAEVIYQQAIKVEYLRFKVECIKALAEMQDMRALALAEALWQLDEFWQDEDYFEDVLMHIQGLQSPLFNRFIEDKLVQTDDPVIIDRLLMALIQNDLGTDYQPFVHFLEHEDDEIRNSALTVIMRRGKEKTLELFKQRLFDPLVSSEFKQDLLYHIAEQKLFEFEAVYIAFLQSIDYAHDSELWIAAWVNYTQLHALAEQPHLRIIQNAVLPVFFSAVDRYLPDDIDIIEQWLGAFMSVPNEIKTTIWNKMESVYELLSDPGKVALLQVVEANALPRFRGLGRREITANNKDIRQLASGILVKVDVGTALRYSNEYPQIMTELFRRAIREDILFFETHIVDPAGNTCSHDFDGAIQVKIG